MLTDVLKITTAGSVDDGKSTLIARLLLDTRSIPEDQIESALGPDADPTKIADLLDGLESEREQGITIDVAHRFFDSGTRRYHLSDSPGHEQYTRNMATAAAGADVLILVIDSSAGIKPQTIKHLDIAYQLGVREFLVAANKIDLVGYSKKRFAVLKSDIADLFSHYPDSHWAVFPTSGTAGDGVVKRGQNMRWYEGPSLLGALDAITPHDAADDHATLSIQFMQRSLGTRLYFGAILGGIVSPGQVLTLLPGNVTATVSTLTVAGHAVNSAGRGAQVCIEIVEDRDIERGALLSNDPTIALSHEWDSSLIWLDSDPGFISRPYIAKLGHQQARVSVTRAWVQNEAGEKNGEVSSLATNGVFRVVVSAQRDFAFAPFSHAQALGRFVLIHPETAQTVAVGTVNFSLRRSDNVHRHSFSIGITDHEKAAGGKGCVLWFTGLSGSGKSTIADGVSQALHVSGRLHTILDGDNLRTGINKDLGFTPEDRVENIRRTSEVASLMADAGLVVLVSLISPYRQDRAQARDIIGPDRFKELYVATSLEVCESRDPKGLYRKARNGEIPNFTGINAPYEAPENPDAILEGGASLKDAVDQSLQTLPG
ncbi:MAG: bifunctional enzyme CysN/CysC [Pontimonas sp.]|jgi:bifunctional enzyme CysN/CysC